MVEVIRKLFPISKEDVKIVRAIYNVSDSKVVDSVKVLRKWIEEQPHLPEKHDDARLERFLMRNQFDIDNTKKQLETYFTMRGLHTVYLHKMADFNLLKKTMTQLYWTPMPKLTPNMERVYAIKWRTDGKIYDVGDIMCYIMAQLEIELSHDYAAGCILVYDIGSLTMDHYKNMDPNVFLKTVKLHQEALCARITGLEFLNAPSYIDLLIALFKIVFNPKLYSKITIHENLNSLYKRVPKECLPLDFGGDQKSFNEIHEDVYVMLKENIGFLSDQTKRVSDETKRIGSVVQDNVFGVKGSFKKINID